MWPGWVEETAHPGGGLIVVRIVGNLFPGDKVPSGWVAFLLPA